MGRRSRAGAVPPARRGEPLLPRGVRAARPGDASSGSPRPARGRSSSLAALPVQDGVPRHVRVAQRAGRPAAGRALRLAAEGRRPRRVSSAERCCARRRTSACPAYSIFQGELGRVDLDLEDSGGCTCSRVPADSTGSDREERAVLAPHADQPGPGRRDSPRARSGRREERLAERLGLRLRTVRSGVAASGVRNQSSEQRAGTAQLCRRDARDETRRTTCGASPRSLTRRRGADRVGDRRQRLERRHAGGRARWRPPDWIQQPRCRGGSRPAAGRWPVRSRPAELRRVRTSSSRSTRTSRRARLLRAAARGVRGRSLARDRRRHMLGARGQASGSRATVTGDRVRGASRAYRWAALQESSARGAAGWDGIDELKAAAGAGRRRTFARPRLLPPPPTSARDASRWRRLYEVGRAARTTRRLPAVVSSSFAAS